MSVALYELEHRPLEPLNHPPQTPLQIEELEELARHVADIAIGFCKPNGDKWIRREIGEPDHETAEVEIFQLGTCTTVPATVEILTPDTTHARTTRDHEGKIHAIVSTREGPYLVDSKEAREAMYAIVDTVFTNPGSSANSHR